MRHLLLLFAFVVAARVLGDCRSKLGGLKG